MVTHPLHRQTIESACRVTRHQPLPCAQRVRKHGVLATAQSRLPARLDVVRMRTPAIVEPARHISTRRIFQEDALARTVERRCDRVIDETHRDRDHAHTAPGVIARATRAVSNVGEPVFEEHEHVRAMISTQPITSTET